MKQKQIHIFLLGLIAIFCCSALSSCYRIPTEDDYSVVPMTNNPQIIREKSSGLMPGAGF